MVDGNQACTTIPRSHSQLLHPQCPPTHAYGCALCRRQLLRKALSKARARRHQARVNQNRCLRFRISVQVAQNLILGSSFWGSQGRRIIDGRKLRSLGQRGFVEWTCHVIFRSNYGIQQFSTGHDASLLFIGAMTRLRLDIESLVVF